MALSPAVAPIVSRTTLRAVSSEIDRNTPDGSNNAQVRFGNYIPGTGALTLATGGSNTALGTAKFGETDNDTAITAATYTLALYDVRWRWRDRHEE